METKTSTYKYHLQNFFFPDNVNFIVFKNSAVLIQAYMGARPTI